MEVQEPAPETPAILPQDMGDSDMMSISTLNLDSPVTSVSNSSLLPQRTESSDDVPEDIIVEVPDDVMIEVTKARPIVSKTNSSSVRI
jgi:hypothetical protein